MNTCRTYSIQIPELFATADHAVTMRLIAEERLGDLEGTLPDDFLDHVRSCPDCPNDILWFLEIPNECDVASFPCLHLAYACSSKANHIVTRHHGLYAVTTGPGTGIVIG